MQKIRFQYFFILLFFWQNFTLSAQNFFLEWENNITFILEKDTLSNALAGGFNAPQFSTIYLNEDALLDLIIFDRTTNKLHTFIAKDKQYRYAPEYEPLFPSMRAWLLTADYDGDGRKDLFTHTNFGIKVYRNTTLQGQNLSFELVADPLRTKGFSSQINLQVPITDIPALIDMDDDGDLDIITFDFIGSFLEYHKNFSVERYGNSSRLEFERVTNCWGDFEEGIACGDFTFNLNCFQEGQKRAVGGGGNPEKVLHVGSTILLLDLNGDKKKDVLIGDVSCNAIYMMLNENTNEQAIFKDFTSNFPVNKPINFPIFPAVFYEDVDFDDKKDLLAAPNVFVNEGNNTNFQHSAWYYKNEQNNENPNFQFQRDNFLQNTMLDLGEQATPVFIDIDADKDLDLLIGNEGLKQANGEFYATLWLFENIGNVQKPIFTLKDKDFLKISTKKATGLIPQFQDLDNDGDLDFILTFTVNNQNKIQIAYNQPLIEKIPNFSLLKDYPLSLNFNDFPMLVDVNRDGKLDALVGNFAGNLSYFQNTGTQENPTFKLITDTLGGITSSPLRTNLRLANADLNKDEKLDLITSDNSGTLKIYSDFRSFLNTTFVSETSIILDTLQTKYSNFPLGSYNTPTIADWNGDNLADIIIGTGGGGVKFLKNTNRGKAFENQNTTELIRLYPNPSQNLLYIFATENIEAQIFNEQGKLILEKVQFLANKESILELQHLPVGVYFLKGRSTQTAKFFSKRFVIVR